jgi:LPS-assembly protein
MRGKYSYYLGSMAYALAAQAGLGQSAPQHDVTLTQDILTPEIAPTHATETPAASSKQSGDFEANNLSYDTEKDLFRAQGNVILKSNGVTLYADGITYNRITGEVNADGEVRLVNTSDNKTISSVYGKNIRLTDNFQRGAIASMLIVMEDGGRLAAAETQMQGDVYTASQAAYTPCKVVDSKGCPKHPVWAIRAARVIYDAKVRKVTYRNARIEVLSLPIVALPYFKNSVGGAAETGLLSPVFDISSNHGVSVGLPFYLRVDDRHDLTITPYVYTLTKPSLQLDYRQLANSGSSAVNLNAFITEGNVVPIDVAGAPTHDSLRASIDGTARFQINKEWNVHSTLRLSSDRSLLKDYDISLDDRLRSSFALERVGANSYFSVENWWIESLRPQESQAQMAFVLPEIDYRKRVTGLVSGSSLNLEVNSLALSRSSGEQTQRAYASAQWDLRRVTGFGQELILTAFARGDIYHSSDNWQQANPATSLYAPYAGLPGWQNRGIAALAAEMRWPFVGAWGGGTVRVTPRVQIVASPPTPNLKMPNEDARSIELDDTNLFALNRFNGYDRWQDGSRLTYGFDWAWNRPGVVIETNIGQSYRLNKSPSLFTDGSSVGDRFSDVVGHSRIHIGDFLSLTHRYRFDKADYVIRRNELDANLGSRKTYASISYLKVDNKTSTLEEETNHEELRIGGRVQLNKTLSVYGSSVVDLTTKGLNAQSVTSGYSPVRQRLGAAYEDSCTKFDLSWVRNYSTAFGPQTGTVVQFRVVLKNLGR